MNQFLKILSRFFGLKEKQSKKKGETTIVPWMAPLTIKENATCDCWSEREQLLLQKLLDYMMEYPSRTVRFYVSHEFVKQHNSAWNLQVADSKMGAAEEVFLGLVVEHEDHRFCSREEKVSMEDFVQAVAEEIALDKLLTMSCEEGYDSAKTTEDYERLLQEILPVAKEKTKKAIIVEIVPRPWPSKGEV